MSVFNGAVGVHVALILRKAAKKFKKQKEAKATRNSYYPLPGRDDDDTASAKSFSSSNAEKGEKPPPPDTAGAWSWILLYFPGMIAGFVGLTSLMIPAWSSNPKLRIITYAFSGVLGFFILFFCLALFYSVSDGLVAIAFGGFGVFATLAALYGDWALGAMANNLLGTPSGDSSGLYWSYFILKRLTMFL